MMGHRALRGLPVLAAIALLPGCGGGGPSGGSGGTGGAGMISPDQRAAVLTAIKTKFDALRGLDVVTANNQMVTFLQSRPEIAAAGTIDESVWARFTDGRMLAIENDNLEAQQSKAQPVAPASATRAFSQLPKGTTVRLLDTLDAAHGWTPDITHPLQSMLVRAGYTVSVEQGTLDDYRRASSADGESVLYSSTHGGYSVYEGGTSDGVFHVWTATPATFPDDLVLNPAIRDDFFADRILPVLATWDITEGTTSEWHWAITDRFVSKYMKFVPHQSLWYMDACNLGRALSFQAQCFRNGLSVFAGWSAPVKSTDTATTALQLFDRLAGANAYQPENPPQRPFDLQATVDYLKSKGLTHVGLPTIPGLFIGGADLKITYDQQNASSNEFGLLAPTISVMTMLGSDLVISGEFGDTPGTVTVGGAEVPSDWGRSTITAHLPDDPNKPGFAGDVVVSVNGIKSNVAQLTTWKLTFHYTNQEQLHGTQTGATVNDTTSYTDYSGSHTTTADVTVYIRCDVRDPRGKPGQTPPDLSLEPQQTSVLKQGLAGTRLASITKWDFNGTETLHTYSTPTDVAESTTSSTWSAGTKTSPPLYFDGSASLTENLDNAQISFSHAGNALMTWITARGSIPLHTVTTGANVNGSLPPTQADTTAFLPFTVAQPDAQSKPYPLKLDGSYGIAGGQITYPNTSTTPYATNQTTVSWDSAAAQYPPDPMATRAARRTH